MNQFDESNIRINLYNFLESLNLDFNKIVLKYSKKIK